MGVFISRPPVDRLSRRIQVASPLPIRIRHRRLRRDGRKQETRAKYETRRVLFMAEAVTLAHVARPHVLANAMTLEGYDVLVACDPRYERLFKRCSVSSAET